MAGADALDLAGATTPAPTALPAAYEAALGDLPSSLPGSADHRLGLPVLREALARRFTERGLATTPEQVLVTHGAQHALGLVLDLAARPGDGVLVEHPTYPAALEVARHRRTRPVPVALDAASWDVDSLAAVARRQRPRLAYLVPEFHNPTGLVMSTAERAAVAATLGAAGVLTVVDETLVDLRLDGGQLPEPLAAHAAADRVVTVGSASKVFWFGLRVGWVRSDAGTVQRLADVRDTLGQRPPVLEQLAVARLLDALADVLAERRAVLGERRAVLLEAVTARLPAWRLRRPDGGLVVWADLGRPCSSALVEAAARRGVRLTPGPCFGVDGSFEERLRLPYVQPPPLLREAVDRIAAAWAETR